MKSPAFQFYPNDFVGGAPALMEPLETHVYVWLMCLDWNQNGFDFDEKNLAKWCRISTQRFRKAWRVVQECFVQSEDRRHRNPRLQRERVKQLTYSEQMRENGKKGGRPKAAVKPQLLAEKAAAKPTESIAVPSPTPLPTTTTTPAPELALTELPARKPSWLDPVAAVYEQRKGVGSFPHGKAGKTLKPLYQAGHSGDEIALRLGRYMDWLDDPKFLSLSRFREMFGDYAESEPAKFRALAGYPVVVDDFGCMTEYGERVTRPKLKLA